MDVVSKGATYCARRAGAMTVQSVYELINESVAFVEKSSLHYHMEILAVDGELKVQASTHYGAQKRALLRPGAATCATCHPEQQTIASLIGVHKKYQVFQQSAAVLRLQRFEYSTMSYDAKGRNLLIFTPNEHVDRFTECRGGVRPLLEEMLAAAPTLRSIVVNQGDYQNHPHLHFKVAFHDWHTLLTEEQASLQRDLVEGVASARADKAIAHSHTMT